MIKESIKSLHQKCQLTHDNWSDHPWTHLQIRKISLYVTWLFLQTSIKPNTMTLIGIGFAFAAAAAFIANALLLAIFFVLLFIVMDFSDGEVSRYRGQTSIEGAYLDKVYIFVGHPVIIGGVAIYLMESEPSLLTTIMGFSSVISIFAFCMVVDYAKKITVSEAFEKIIFSSNPIDKLDGPILFEDLDTLNNKSTSQWLRSKLNFVLDMFDFPYVFLILSLFVLLEVFVPFSLFGLFTPLKVFIYAFGVLCPCVIILSLWKTLSHKKIKYQLDEMLDRVKK